MGLVHYEFIGCRTHPNQKINLIKWELLNGTLVNTGCRNKGKGLLTIFQLLFNITLKTYPQPKIHN